jgi:CheY-like chemotaxis protein
MAARSNSDKKSKKGKKTTAAKTSPAARASGKTLTERSRPARAKARAAEALPKAPAQTVAEVVDTRLPASEVSVAETPAGPSPQAAPLEAMELPPESAAPLEMIGISQEYAPDPAAHAGVDTVAIPVAARAADASSDSNVSVEIVEMIESPTEAAPEGDFVAVIEDSAEHLAGPRVEQPAELPLEHALEALPLAAAISVVEAPPGHPQPEPAPRAPLSPQADGPPKPIKILLVEDASFLRLAIERALARAGYSVVTAIDGEQGIEAARKAQPDLILLDLLLPKVGGQDVLKALKKDPATAGIAVVVLTGLSQMNAERLQADGALAFLEKSALALEKGSGVLLEALQGIIQGLPWAQGRKRPAAAGSVR